MRYDLNRDFKKVTSGVVVLSRDGERWRRLIGESELVRLWNVEQARYACLHRNALFAFNIDVFHAIYPWSLSMRSPQ